MKEGSWKEHLWRRLNEPQPLTLDQIAERHACEELGAVVPSDGSKSNRKGFDVMLGNQRVEVKSKKDALRRVASRYVGVTESKRHCDKFWVYLFGETAEELDVWEIDTEAVFANLDARKGTAIKVATVQSKGRRIWSASAAG